MFTVPTYQIFEFLEYLRVYEKKIMPEDDAMLRKYAAEFLTQKNNYRRRRNLGLLLRIFQNCPKINERELIQQMKHFSTCGQCFTYINKYSVNNSKLHPFLYLFEQYIENRYSYIIQRIEEVNCELGSRVNYNKWLKEILENIGNLLYTAFEDYLIHFVDEKRIEDFMTSNRLESSKCETDYRDESALDLRTENIEQESYRLAESIIQNIYSSDNKMQFLIGQVMDERWTIEVEFIEWLFKRYPKIELSGNIPLAKINELTITFMNQRGLDINKKILKDIENLFIDQKKYFCIEKIIAYLNNNKKKSIKYKRYCGIKTHGLFLYPNCKDINLENFINSKWENLNSLTSNYIDIYYNESEYKLKNAFDILYSLDSLSHIQVDKLPALIIWQKELRNSIAIPLRDINDAQKFELMQTVVQCIRENKSIHEIENEAITFINQKKIKNEFGGKIMGDVNINNGTAGIMGGNHQNVNVVIGETASISINDLNEEVISDLNNLINKIEGATDIERRDQRKCVGILEALKESMENKDEKKYSNTLIDWNTLKKELKEGTLKMIGLVADAVTIGTCLKVVLGL